MRTLLGSLIAVVVSCSSGYAQQAKVSPADLKQQVEQLTRIWDDTFNKRDLSGLASLFTDDAVYVPPSGLIVEGRDAIAKMEGNIIKQFGGEATVENRVDQAQPLTGGAWAIGHFTVKGKSEINGHWAAVYVRQSGQLKARMLTGAIDAKPPGNAAQK